jgi:riboflavin kinase / FMN adenylyltransferase
MEVILGIENVQRSIRNPVLTIGNFDGVHRGHQALFQKVKEWATRLQGESVVMTFDPHPLQVLGIRPSLPFITPHERKLELIETCGIDVTIVLPFDKDFALMSARDFVRKLLVERIGIKGMVVGYDYRFGHGREGDIGFLRKIGKEYEFEVDTVSQIQLDKTVVSSTAIRELIKEGELKEANRLLGRSYEIRGTVVVGQKRGARLLGFPTANVDYLASSQAVPKPGVYAVEVELEGEKLWGAANLGYNPTFGDAGITLEVHIIDFDREIYGMDIAVRFVDRLRDEKRFSGPQELALQIRGDVENAKEVLRNRDSIQPR